MGASRLLQVSQILRAPVQYFFDGLEELEVVSESLRAGGLAIQRDVPLYSSSDTAEIFELFGKIQNAQVRHHLSMLIKHLSGTDQLV